jgi:Fe2+ transport system protein B
MHRCVQAVKILLAVALATLSAAWAAPATEAEPAGGGQPSAGTAAPLVFFNRTIIEFRSPFLGMPATERAARARSILGEILREGGDLTVAVKANPEGRLVMINDRLAFVVTSGDVDPLLQENIDKLAKRAAQRLEQVVAETREARSLEAFSKALTAAAIATAVFVLLLWCIRWLRLRGRAAFLAAMERKFSTLKIGGAEIVEGSYLLTWVSRVLTALRWLVILLLTFVWLCFVLSRFPFTSIC